MLPCYCLELCIQLGVPFKLWCWRTLLIVPWTARSNQSILKEINPEYSLEGLMLKLKLQYFGPLMRRANSLEKSWCWERLMAGGDGVIKSEMVGWHHELKRRELEQTPGDGKGQGSLAHCSPLGLKELDTTWWLNSNKQQDTKIKWRVQRLPIYPLFLNMYSLSLLSISSISELIFLGVIFKLRLYLFKISFRTSLVVQWIRTHLAMQGTQADPWSGKIPQAVGQLSPCATTTGAWKPRAHASQQEKPP